MKKYEWIMDVKNSFRDINITVLLEELGYKDLADVYNKHKYNMFRQILQMKKDDNHGSLTRMSMDGITRRSCQ